MLVGVQERVADDRVLQAPSMPRLCEREERLPPARRLENALAHLDTVAPVDSDEQGRSPPSGRDLTPAMGLWKQACTNSD